MNRSIAPTRAWLYVAAALPAVLWLSACETGFGQPCDLPQTEEFRSACSATAPAEDETSGDESGEIQKESKASCAVKQFAGCSTRVCLVYRGSSAFCSEQCTGDGDCEGDAVCRPIIGDDPPTPELCRGVECYCVRQGDLND